MLFEALVVSTVCLLLDKVTVIRVNTCKSALSFFEFSKWFTFSAPPCQDGVNIPSPLDVTWPQLSKLRWTISCKGTGLLEGEGAEAAAEDMLQPIAKQPTHTLRHQADKKWYRPPLSALYPKPPKETTIHLQDQPREPNLKAN